MERETKQDYWEGFSTSDFIIDYSSKSLEELETRRIDEFLKEEIKNLPPYVTKEVFTEEELEDLGV